MKKTVSTSTNDKFSHTNALIDRIEKILDVDLDLKLSDGELSHLTISKDKIRYGIVFESEDSILFLNRINQDSEKKSIMKEKFDIGEIKSIEISGNGEIKVTFKDESINFYAGEEEPERSFFEPKIIPKYDGTEKSLLENIEYLFSEEDLKDCIYFDELRQKLFFDKRLIGSSGLKEYDAKDELTSLIVYLQEHLPKTKSGSYQRIYKQRLDDVVVKLGNENVRNLFLEMIRKTEPSSVRCEDFLLDIGCNTNLNKGEDNEIYLKAVSAAMFLAIIERLLSDGDTPPIKFVPVIIGETNKGKSTICSRLGLSHYYRQTTQSIDDEKRYNESVQGCVIAEMSEGVHMKSQNEETLKAFFDKVMYQYRKSYGRESKEIVKRYLEIITTNNNEILTDVTGNVRYYPIRYDLLEEPPIPIYEYTDEMILQYYADALELYRQGKRWQDYVNVPEVQKLAEILRARSTKEIEGLPELQEIADRLAPDIGDFVSTKSLKKGLEDYDEEFRYNEKKVERAIRMFKKACDRFGFRIEPTPRKDKDGSSQRGLIRIKHT